MKTFIKSLLCLLIILSFSCDNEPVDTTTIVAEDPIGVNSELYNNIQRVTDDNPGNKLVCIDFNYAFTLNVFDQNLEYAWQQTVSNDLEFSSFLELIQDDYFISLSYPITSTTLDGETIEINSNEDLKNLIDGCLREENLGYCNSLLTAPDCIWKVIENDQGNSDYENAYFDIDDLGATTFFYEDTTYSGTWITFYIENELHVNISLDDDTAVGNDWNIDWKVTIVDEDHMILETEGRTFFIERECQTIEEDCATLEFEACELNQDEGIAEFSLEEYIECIANFIEYDITENTVVGFYTTQIDAEANVNAIPTEVPFLNTVNPQILIVRFENTELMDVVFTSMNLIATDCED